MARLRSHQPSEITGRDLSARRKTGRRAVVFWSGFLSSLLLAVAVLLATANALVIGADERTELTDNERQEFRAVGLIASGDRPRGTAFLLCDCLTVVTSAHVAISRNAQTSDEDIAFLHDGHEGIPHLVDKMSASFGFSATLGSYNPQRDWLIARLVRPVSDCQPLQYGPWRGVEEWKTVSMVAFHGDVREKRISKDCAISHVLRDKGLLVHMCDGAAGSSGAPMLLSSGGHLDRQTRVVAIQSGEQRSVGFNVAVLFSEEFERALAQHVPSCEIGPHVIAGTNENGTLQMRAAQAATHAD